MSEPAKPVSDPYARSPENIQPAPATFTGSLFKIGPGLILAGAIVGTGELIATTNAGAKVGFALLWLVLFSCFIKVFVQVELGRYTVSSGDTTLQALKSIPAIGTVCTWWWLLMMLGTQTQLAAMVGGTGQALHRMLPGVAPTIANLTGWETLLARPDYFWAPLSAVATSIALAIGSYKLVEFGTTIMVVGFTLMTVLCVAFLPAGTLTGSDIAYGLGFHIPPEHYVVAFAMFGITGVGAAELIVYPYWCIEKGYARYAGPREDSKEWESRAKGWMRVMQIDAWFAMLIYTAATVSFYLLGAAFLHEATQGKGIPGDAMLDVLSKMYEPIMGSQWASIFISFGAFAVLYSTLFASTAANSRALADFTHVNGYKKFTSGDDRKRLVRLLVILFPIFDLALYLFVGNPVMLVTIGAVGQGLTLPMIAFAALYLRFKRTDPRLRPGPLWTGFLVVSLIAFCVTAAYVLSEAWPKIVAMLK